MIQARAIARGFGKFSRDDGDYYRMVVQPIVGSTVRRVLAGRRANELGTPGILRGCP